MGGLRIFFILILFIIIGVLIFYGYRIKNMAPPSSGSKSCLSNGQLWSNNDCKIPQEITPDSSLKSPSGKKLKVISFTADAGFPSKPYNAYMWYRFRYVNTTNGGYSTFSEWNSTPIYAGSCCLDCIDSNTLGICNDPNTKFGTDSCKANRLEIGILASDLDYLLTSNPNIVTVVHSYLSRTPDLPPTNAPANPIGYLYGPATYYGQNYYSLLDLSDPCGDQSFPPIGLCTKQPIINTNGCTSDSCVS